MRLFIILALALAAAPLFAGERLAQAASLYLRQHAGDPVDWHEWSGETLEKAARLDKLIFVSVGYAACHWCHVMREESFVDPDIAASLNRDFIAIKIDRETRPDLDEQFQVATAIMGAQGGWPNSVFLTPSGDPFHAGGYFPPEVFAQVLDAVSTAWMTDRTALTANGFRVASALREYMDQASGNAALTQSAIDKAIAGLIEAQDPFQGGFGATTKFPREPVLGLLFDHAQRSGDDAALETVLAALDAMIKGGIHDNVGGGFHRYTVDPDWHVPHFEKMLYNQALIARLLTRAWAVTGAYRYRRAAERTLDYVLRDMTAAQGGFFSAEDADSVIHGERREGAFYTWTHDAFAQALGPSATGLARQFGVEADGAFEGTNILRLTETPRDAADWARIDAGLAVLDKARKGRVRPIRDEKILTAWNGEMIATLAEAGRLFGNAGYEGAARRAAQFILREMWTETGLKRVYFDGRADGDAQLADYGALGIALLSLARHDTHPPRDWAADAEKLGAEMLTRFHDAGRSLRMTQTSGPLGPVRPLDDTEQASGNALALQFLSGLERQAGVLDPRIGELSGLLTADALNAPMQRAGLLAALTDRQSGPATVVRQVAAGAVTATAQFDRRERIMRVVIRIAEGWHVNAHEPLEDYLLPTSLEIEGTPLDPVGYPQPIIRQLGFSNTPLALYEGVKVLEIPTPQGGSFLGKLSIQACNDAQCLQPEDLAWRFWQDG